MERRVQARLDELRRDAQVPPGLLRGVAARLHAFLRPVLASPARDQTRDNAGRYVQGLLSNLEARTAEGLRTRTTATARGSRSSSASPRGTTAR